MRDAKQTIGSRKRPTSRRMIVPSVLATAVLLIGAWVWAAPASTVAASRPTSYASAAVISIDSEITEITRDSIERRLKQVNRQGIPLVIFELDTPGGSLGATLEICDLIKSARDRGLNTFAWVNKQAYSAGTIIALATDGIMMASNATIGDCKPIVRTAEGVSSLPKDIEAKAMSPLLAELRDSARRNGYDMRLLTALVRETQLFWVANTETGEKRFVGTEERDELFGLATASAPAGSADKESRPEPVPDDRSRTMWRYVKQAPGLSQVPQPILTHRELLTMRTDEAIAYGFCLSVVNSQAELSSRFGVRSPLERLDTTWFESAVDWLASPIVRGVLFLLILLGAYAEFQHPGLSLPGAVAVVALILFLGAPYAAGFTVTWEIVIIILGIGLLAVELFVIPGFGVTGILGIIMLVVGLVASFVPQEPGFGRGPHWPTLPSSYEYLRRGLWSLSLGFTAALGGMVAIARYLPRVPIASRLIAPNPTREQVVVDDPYNGAAQVGDIGKTEGPLRPAGKARFGAMLIDVVSEGEYIDKDIRVEVIERCGSRVVVRRVD